MSEIAGFSVSAWMVAIFIVGYAAIVLEDAIRINKATSALIMAVLLWVLVFVGYPTLGVYPERFLHRFTVHLATASQVILFLMGALTVVKTIEVHGGFELIWHLIQVSSKRTCLWLVGAVTFLMSSVLDNLTTTIFMLALMKNLVPKDRLIFGAAIVIAANCGGIWTPIGDVTTTMLWIGGQLSTWPMIHHLIVPSLTCLVVALMWFSFFIQGEIESPIGAKAELAPHGKLVFVLGILSLIFVPFFRAVTGLPPFMGMVLAMAFMWLLTDILHRDYRERLHLRVVSVFAELDLAVVFFFLGILLSIGALEAFGLLSMLAMSISEIGLSTRAVTACIGLLSSVIDNVPLVAACMGMYHLSIFPQDSEIWMLIAYAAGAGGSILIIGSAAGVAFMSEEEIGFLTYLRKATIPALLGYAAGFFAYFLFPCAL